MNVLITGVTGFIGAHLAHELLKKKSYDLVGTFRDAEKALMYEKQGIEMRKADLLKPDSLKNITKDVDVVVHLAGLMRFHDSWDLLYNHNVKATQIIVADALQHSVQHFINKHSRG
jgi:nucleoside-diphosphate-sugar epimerase